MINKDREMMVLTEESIKDAFHWLKCLPDTHDIDISGEIRSYPDTDLTNYHILQFSKVPNDIYYESEEDRGDTNVNYYWLQAWNINGNCIPLTDMLFRKYVERLAAYLSYHSKGTHNSSKIIEKTDLYSLAVLRFVTN